MESIEILKAKLNEHTKALRKSRNSFKRGDISPYVHEVHKKNLEPKIKHLFKAIEVLEKHFNK